MLSLRIALGFTLAALVATSALAADVTGTWVAQVPARDGNTMEVTFKLKADGDKLTGSQSSQFGEAEISEGKVTGDKIAFKIKREFGGNTVVFNYEGAVSGDEIKFKQTFEGFDRPPREFTAKRSK